MDEQEQQPEPTKPRLIAYVSRTLKRGDWDLTPLERAQAIVERNKQKNQDEK